MVRPKRCYSLKESLLIFFIFIENKMNYQLFGLFSILLSFQTLEAVELIPKLEDKALNKGNRPGANLWSDEAVEIATKGPHNGGFADSSGNQVRGRPVSLWEQPSLPLASNQKNPSPFDQQNSPQTGLDGRTRPVVSGSSGEGKERGWQSWNHPQSSWGGPDSDEWSNEQEIAPILAPLPQHSWNQNQGQGKPCCGQGGGKGQQNGWGIPSINDEELSYGEKPSYGLGWGDQTGGPFGGLGGHQTGPIGHSQGVPLPPPLPIEDQPGQSNDWGEPSWNLPMISSDEQEEAPEDTQPELSSQWDNDPSKWGPSSIPVVDNIPSIHNSYNHNPNYENGKPVCTCEQPQQKKGQEQQRGNEYSPLSLNNFPVYPSVSNSYAPIRPNRQQKPHTWNHIETMPWNQWDRGVKDKKPKTGLKVVDSADKVKVEEVASKEEEAIQAEATPAPAPVENEGENKVEERVVPPATTD